MYDQVESLDKPAELTVTEEFQALDAARTINNIFDRGKRQVYIIALVRANMLLLRELNEARHALGLPDLPVVDNSKARIR